MKTLLFIGLSAAFAFAALAAEEKKTLTPEEKAARAEMRMKKTGGIVMKKGVGKIVVINAQQKYGNDVVEHSFHPIIDKLKIGSEVRMGTWKFGDKVPSDANIVIYVVDDATLPMSLVAMESRWGLVNVSALDTPQRFDREFIRVAIATMGAFVSQYKVSPMQPVYSPEDLDALVGTALTVDAGMGMRINFEKLGITIEKMTTYRKACEEGWAAQPTNDYQKAIWNEVHALPTEPLKLKK